MARAVSGYNWCFLVKFIPTFKKYDTKCLWFWKLIFVWGGGKSEHLVTTGETFWSIVHSFLQFNWFPSTILFLVSTGHSELAFVESYENPQPFLPQAEAWSNGFGGELQTNKRGKTPLVVESENEKLFYTNKRALCFVLSQVRHPQWNSSCYEV